MSASGVVSAGPMDVERESAVVSKRRNKRGQGSRKVNKYKWTKQMKT